MEDYKDPHSSDLSISVPKLTQPCTYNETLGEGKYEVENIVDYNPIGDLYLVKWKGWSHNFNTWEPRKHFYNCVSLLINFFVARRRLHYQLKKNLIEAKKRIKCLPKVPIDPRSLEEQLNEYFIYYDEISNEEMKNCILKYGTNFNKPIVCGRQFSNLMGDALSNTTTQKEKQRLRDIIIKYFVWDKKQKADCEIKEWLLKINIMTDKCPTIRVENHIDLETPPKEFQFRNKTDISLVQIPVEPQTGCPCDGDCLNKKSCCGHSYGSESVYNRSGRLIALPGTPIYECNALCDCGVDCHNRQIQDGVECLKGMEFCIFRLGFKIGWGVKTMKSIRKGTFVSFIVGEVITVEEATRRRFEEIATKKYIFFLDFYADKFPLYALDFGQKGNISHFMNHSCGPNLTVYPVWINCRNPYVPQLALFSNEDILPNTELTYSYVNLNSVKEELKNYNRKYYDTTHPPPGFQFCLCGSKNCLKFIKFPI